MSQLFLELFCCKSPFNSLTNSVKVGISAWLCRFSWSFAGIHPHKTDQIHNENHCSKPTSDKSRLEY